MKLWPKLLITGKLTFCGKASLIAELWLRPAFSNATLDRFLNYMNKIKTDTRSQLSPTSLSALLQINFLGTSSKNSTGIVYIIAIRIAVMPNINLSHKRNEKEYKERENHSTYKNFICVLLKETTNCWMSKEQTFSITVFFVDYSVFGCFEVYCMTFLTFSFNDDVHI